jgi:hypothetical protein
LLFFSSILRKRRVNVPKDLVWRLLRVLRGLILLRTLSRNPLVALFVVVLFDRRARGVCRLTPLGVDEEPPHPTSDAALASPPVI